MPIALLSVSDKRGIVELGRSLQGRGWEIVSTGGTARALRSGDVPVTEIGEFTGFPELMGGRVKTLHPAVHAGILARRAVVSDMEELQKHELSPIDLVAVNLYPFRETVARQSVSEAEALEQIDIGGPTLLRAAAKNHPFVWVVCDPDDYDTVLGAIEAEDDPDLRRRLAAKVFLHTAAYDAAIAGHLEEPTESEATTLPAELLWPLERVQSLRYGENPDQAAAFYRDPSAPAWGVPGLKQLQGKELSYNNLLDVDGALLALAPFLQSHETAACAILKHTTPCGLAVGRTCAEAFEKARACDPMSAFGSTVAFSQPVTEAAAEAMSDLFVECVVAPGYAGAALRLLQAKSKLRILEPEEGVTFGLPAGHVRPGLDARGIRGGLLVQTAPAPVAPAAIARGEGTTVPTERQPTEAEWVDLGFAWAAIQSVKSNAILLARDGATIGIGAGQMSRVDAVKISVRKAGEAGLPTEDCVLASDAFFPFRDNIDVAAAAGVRAVIQPGGSIRDDEVVQAADEHGIAMVFAGRRLFRH